MRDCARALYVDTSCPAGPPPPDPTPSTRSPPLAPFFRPSSGGQKASTCVNPTSSYKSPHTLMLPCASHRRVLFSSNAAAVKLIYPKRSQPGAVSHYQHFYFYGTEQWRTGDWGGGELDFLFCSQTCTHTYRDTHTAAAIHSVCQLTGSAFAPPCQDDMFCQQTGLATSSLF